MKATMAMSDDRETVSNFDFVLSFEKMDRLINLLTPEGSLLGWKGLWEIFFAP